MTFEEHVGNAMRGDNDALCKLLEMNAKNILYRTTLLLGNEMDAEDVSQNILLRICEKIGTLRAPEAFRTWMSGIIINETRRFIREKAKLHEVVNIDDYIEAFLEDETAAVQLENVEYESVNEAVMEFVSCLPIRQREAILLHYFDDLKINEVAWAMDLPHQSVTRYLELARKKLKAELDNQPLVSKMNSIALLPLGAMLTDSLQSQATVFMPATTTWLQNAIDLCNQVIVANSAEVALTGAAAVTTAIAGTAAIAGKASAKTATRVSRLSLSFGAIMGSLTAIFATIAIFLGISIGGTPIENFHSEPAQSPEITGKVMFTGGEYHRGTERVNPTNAELTVDGASGEVTMLQWWITEANSEAVLYEGQGSDLHGTLTMLRNIGDAGEYMLFFRCSDESGAIFRIGSNFFIE